MTTTKPTELHLSHRPALFKEVIGQPDAVRVLMQMLKTNKVPHALLFTGPSGCGKTTLSRLVTAKLGCCEGDLQEINAADFRGIDTVRDLRTRASLHPMYGPYRVFIIDECHQLSKDAQNALLKMLEDTPSHVYFFLATTEPAKLLRTITTRCTEIKVREMNPLAQRLLLKQVAEAESLVLSDAVLDKIIECAGGSARAALVLLNKIQGLEEDEQIDAIEKNAANQQGILLARALLNSAPWSTVAALIKTIDEEPESIRWMVLSYMSAVMLGGGKLAGRAADILDGFQFNFFDTKKAGLIKVSYALCRR